MTIRRVPRDFVVRERAAPGVLENLSAAHRRGLGFAWYTLTKESLTTPDACAFLAKRLGVKPGTVAWAGLKDRHAFTQQMVSVRLDDRADAAAPEAVENPTWTARRLGFAPSPISADSIDGNIFEITIRRLQRRDTGVFTQRIAALSLHAPRPSEPDEHVKAPEPIDPVEAPSVTLLVLNAFGDQRFGSARHGEGFAARLLVRGEFEAALKLLIATPARKDSGPWRSFTRLCAQHWGDWNKLLELLPRRAERGCIEALARGGAPSGTMRDAFAALPAFTQQMCVEAYQSWLWNRTAFNVATRIDPNGPVADDDFGPIRFPRARFVDEQTERLTIPMPAPGITLHEPWGPALDTVLREEGLTLDGLTIPGLRRPAFGSAERPLFVRASRFSISDPEPDDLAGAGQTTLLKRIVRFDLPRGAYATVVLRALGQ
ncbi:MAG: tRNA pseudouridine(13) synthase TruD [Phycisphaerales bacterium]